MLNQANKAVLDALVATTDNTNTEREALLPCPFCGGNARNDAHADDCYFMMYRKLNNSGADMSLAIETLDAWNRRASLSLPHPTPAAQGDALTQAARDVLAERQRQIGAEGWKPERDDQYLLGELALAGAAYAMQSVDADDEDRGVIMAPQWWPWAQRWWKPTSRRRMLEKAGALILAELERLDRAAIAAQKGRAA